MARRSPRSSSSTFIPDSDAGNAVYGSPQCTISVSSFEPLYKNDQVSSEAPSQSAASNASSDTTSQTNEQTRPASPISEASIKLSEEELEGLVEKYSFFPRSMWNGNGKRIEHYVDIFFGCVAVIIMCGAMTLGIFAILYAIISLYDKIVDIVRHIQGEH